MRRAASSVAARLASAAGASSSSSSSHQFTTSAAVSARLGARAGSRSSPGRRITDSSRDPEWWEEAGWLDTALNRGGGAAGAHTLLRRVQALGAQATSALPTLAAAIKTPADAEAALKALIALRASRAARGQTAPLPGRTSGAVAAAVVAALAPANAAGAAAFLGSLPRYGLQLGPAWVARTALKALASADPAAGVAAVRNVAGVGAGGPNAAAAALAVAAAAGRPDLAASWAAAYEAKGVRLGGAARSALARAAEGGKEVDTEGGTVDGGEGEK